MGLREAVRNLGADLQQPANGEGRPSGDGISSRSVCPSTTSMTMKGRPEVWPISWMVMMFGWLSEEAARASWAKRPMRLVSAAKRSGRNFTATSR